MVSYWILKTEPDTYSYSDMERDKTSVWDGVRNYQARNNLKAMKIGDRCFVYHSVGPREIVGVAEVTKEYYPDPTADNAAWVVVELKPIQRLKNAVTLQELKAHPRLKNIQLVKQSRLSVVPLSEPDARAILALAGDGSTASI